MVDFREETIFINEESIWYGKDRDRKNPDTLKHLEEIRALLLREGWRRHSSWQN